MLIAPADIGEDTVVVPGSHVGVVEIEDRILLVDEAAGRGHALNPTATLVWRLLGTRVALGELIDEMSAAFSVPRREVDHSVIGLVRNLGALGLLDGVFRSLESVPIDIEFVDPDDCAEPEPPTGGRLEAPEFDAHYLAAPPNA